MIGYTRRDIWLERRLGEGAGSQGGGCHGGPGRERDSWVQVPSWVSRKEWAKEGTGGPWYVGYKGGRGDKPKTCSGFQYITEGAK